mgnify:CR=1 FL=1
MAHAELEQTIGRKVDPIRLLKFESGRQETLWIKNVLSVGLCAAFAEPLEATSIHTTIMQLKDFVFSCLSTNRDITCNEGTVNKYNNDKQSTPVLKDQATAAPIKPYIFNKLINKGK